ncbi:hypothetical protein GBAR_LOCUS12961 [Geodia barretti]|uniref:Uncharacterized protein n=2 Tax=Geodia barretti TaxID=519541 RepID=A0AA35WPZ3_GEOBA|nr:hypothetical protein GBAR_LOCUS12961 [Geodia barretti]
MEAEEETGLAGPRRGVRVTRHSYVAMSEKWTGLNVRLLCTPPTSPVAPDMDSVFTLSEHHRWRCNCSVAGSTGVVSSMSQ